ncbi:Hsp33 family molecular chaperone HslO [Reinekea marinisedimentorum]|uniref:Molecular chaperone Hsp33 n=1 Tax=Reinekea marinisedimentorum TaxID=230495 RepID=A0A4R3IBJ1_9GAMM|nr:Hsp33 family molecular chaperone HslO [Reinekea marinisedimentorum]TCS43989.1 molecular chaperone Hsp33 [Reinekea marinisedimentorum]
MTVTDTTTRFLFEDTHIRGELTQIARPFQEVLSKHNYPRPIQPLLGQFMAAAAMLSDTIKFEGILSLQVKGNGQVRTLMAECRNNQALRAIAQYNDDFEDSGPLLGEGHLAITIDPDKGQRYQGIVLINDDDIDLASALEGYFQQSEQIKTRVWLYADHNAAAGMMLQAMPKSASESSLDLQEDEDWERLNFLAETLKPEEALNLDSETVLHRLFHEETVRVYPARELRFECTCSEQRSANAIMTLGQQEALEIAHEQGHIEIDCQFCRARYAFSLQQVEELFSPKPEDSIN